MNGDVERILEKVRVARARISAQVRPGPITYIAIKLVFCNR